MILQILQSFSQSLEQFFLTVGQNNLGNQIPFIIARPNYCKKEQKMNISWPEIPLKTILLDYIMSKPTSVKCGLIEIIELKAN